MRSLAVALLFGACTSSDPMNAAMTYTLTVSTPASNSAIVGNTLDCGMGSACDGTMATACTVKLVAGTHVGLHVVHPVCPATPSYTSFLWTSPPCLSTPSYTCDFDIDADYQIHASGGTTVR